MITTVIIDALKRERDRVVSILSIQRDIKVLAHGKDGYDALKFIGSLKPDIAIMDNHLEFINGQEIPPLIRRRSPSTAIVILTSKISDYQIYRAVCNEVSGIVHKESDMDTFPWVLNYVSRGGYFISPFFTGRVLHLLSFINWNSIDVYLSAEQPQESDISKSIKNRLPSRNDPAFCLSKTELLILSRIGEGCDSSLIAEELKLAVGTVRNYISLIMRKTGLHTRPRLVRYALRHGLVRHP